MSESSSVHAAARAFDRAGEAYDRGRPGYPSEAVDWLVDALGLGAGRTVLDLAAGTGKFTRFLVPTGVRVVAVEPADGMRVRLASALPEVVALAGTAEAIPLADGAADAVVVAQVFHWFDGDAALAEIHRVLVSGGRLGLIWNGRDDSEGWVAGLTEIMDPYRGDAPRYFGDAWREAFERTELFTPLRHGRFRLVHELDADGVVARVTSVSFIAALSEDERKGVVERVRSLRGSHPETRGRTTFGVPYRTDVFWCVRKDTATTTPPVARSMAPVIRIRRKRAD